MSISPSPASNQPRDPRDFSSGSTSRSSSGQSGQRDVFAELAAGLAGGRLGERERQATGPDDEATFAQVVRDLSEEEKALLRETGRAPGLADVLGEAAGGVGGMVKDQRVPVLPVISPRVLSLVSWRAKQVVAREFSAVRVSRRGPAPVELSDDAVLVYCHVASAWAQHLGLVIAQSLWPAWRHYSAMARDGASRYSLWHKAGFFPVTVGAAGAKQVFRTATQVLMCPGQMLWMGATTRVTDPRRQPAAVSGMLQRLVARLARQELNVQLLPVAVEHPYWQGGRPEALVRFGEVVSLRDAGRRSRQGWEQFLSRRLAMTQQRLAEQAMEGDENEFETLTG